MFSTRALALLVCFPGVAKCVRGFAGAPALRRASALRSRPRAIVSQGAELGENGGDGDAPKASAARGHIYFIATPIGNYDDITLRALRVLRDVDLVAAEDTRRTGLLLAHHGLSGKRLISYHEHNWRERVPELVRRAQEEGTSIAVVSDAGTPGISDPGAELAAACAVARVPTVPLPGACAAVAALSVAGLPSLEWVFYGFLPSAGSERKKQLARVAGETRACVLYEAPHRLLSTLQGLVDAGASARGADGGLGTTGGRRVLCARELTKVHEELYRGTLDDALRHYGEGGAGILKGEFTIVLHPDGARAASDAALAADDQRESVAALLAEQAAAGALLSAAVRDVCAQTGAPKREVYAKALEMPRGDWRAQRDEE